MANECFNRLILDGDFETARKIAEMCEKDNDLLFGYAVFSDENDGKIIIHYTTNWSSYENKIHDLSEKFKDIRFTLISEEYNSNSGWANIIKNGECLEQLKWDLETRYYEDECDEWFK